MRLCLFIALLSGCGRHAGLRVPGPMRGVGVAPASYVERLDALAETPEAEEDAVVAAVMEEDPEPRAEQPRRRRRGDSRGQAVARTAGDLVGARRLVVRGDTFRYDCSGFVAAAHAGARVELGESSRGLYDLARDEGLLHRRRVPAVGDIAFFDNTYDRNRNRRRDDQLTHVAIVESVDQAGTITLVHKGSRGVVRMEMNLKHPSERRDADGRELNDYLRSSSDKDGGPVLSGQLWRAFASLWALEPDGVTVTTSDSGLDDAG